MALLQALYAVYRGEIPEIAGAGNGIDEREQAKANYQPLRLLIHPER